MEERGGIVSRMPMGMYLPGESCLHGLDPLSKLVGFMIFIAAVILTDSVQGYALLGASIGGMIALSGLPPGTVFGLVRRMYLFFIIIFFMNAFFFDTADPLWSWWVLGLSRGGMVQGANVVLRLIIVIIAGGILTATTSPMEITSALKRLLKPLGYIRVPVDILSMIISVAIQFIPVLSEEVDAIRRAQMARGAKFEGGRLRERVESMFPLVIPIFLGAFRRADELALAVEARGYRCGRKRINEAKNSLHLRDAGALFITLGVLVVQIFVF
jgi:energy-coupling factor transport system permease protein